MRFEQSFPQATWAILGVLTLAGCASSGLCYTGDTAQPRAPTDVIELHYVPKDAKTLGSAYASCRAPEPGNVEKATLGDLRCSPELLTLALRRQAAAAGGNLLLQLECDAGEEVDSAIVNYPRRERASCQAKVALGEASPRPGQVEPDMQLPRDSVLDAWRVEVDSRWAPEADELRQAKHGIQPGHPARVVPRVPAFDRPLALIDARCEGRCDTSALQAGVVAAATHLGAQHVMLEECIQLAAQVQCSGVASSPHL